MRKSVSHHYTRQRNAARNSGPLSCWHCQSDFMLALCLCPVINPWCPHRFSQVLFLTELPWGFFLHLCYLVEAGNLNCCCGWQKTSWSQFTDQTVEFIPSVGIPQLIWDLLIPDVTGFMSILSDVSFVFNTPGSCYITLVSCKLPDSVFTEVFWRFLSQKLWGNSISTPSSEALGVKAGDVLLVVLSSDCLILLSRHSSASQKMRRCARA